MKHILIVANWKSNPDSTHGAVSLARAVESAHARFRRVRVIVAPPFPFIESVRAVLKSVHVAAQDVFWDKGPFTGEVSPHQLKSLGVRYVIIGHSERRMYGGETDDRIQKKLAAALAKGISPIVCVGERERNGKDIPALVGDQIRKALSGIPARLVSRVIIAYEPVWAISTNSGATPDTPENAFRAKMYIRRVLTDIAGQKKARGIPILYGGSVSPANITSFLQDGEMDGALVGGASIDPKQFSDILRIVSRL